MNLNEPLEQEQPRQKFYDALVDAIKLNTSIGSVSAANIIEECDALGIKFAQASGNLTDELTGLNTTAGILKAIEKEGQAIGGYNTDDDTIVVAHIDIENFRRFNEAYGPLAGDVILEELATRLKDQSRYRAILGRTQGDEMVVIFTDGHTSEDQALDDIQKSLANMSPILFESKGQIAGVEVKIDKPSAQILQFSPSAVSYTHLRAHETVLDLVCRLLLEKKNRTLRQHRAAHILN